MPAKSGCPGSGRPADFTENIRDEKQETKSNLSDMAGSAVNAAEGVISRVEGEEVRGVMQIHESDSDSNRAAIS